MAKTILTVDDSVSMRQMITFTLAKAGYDVMEASDGVEALAQLTGRTVDLVITDINMPNMDGITLVQRLRALADFRYTPILVLTTEAGPDLKQRGREAGATGWIVKPFSPEKLLAVVEKVL